MVVDSNRTINVVAINKQSTASCKIIQPSNICIKIYLTKSIIRAIYTADKGPSGRLAVFGASVKKSIAELLQDLREGDAIADAWGK